MTSTLFSLLLLAGAIVVVLFAYWRRRRGGAPLGGPLGALGIIVGFALLAGAAWVALRGGVHSQLSKTEPATHEAGASRSGGSSVSPPAESAPSLSAPLDGAARTVSASGTGEAQAFPPNPALMRQHLKTLQEEIERARTMTHQERQKSDELNRRLNDLESRVKALTQELDEQDQRARQLRERLDNRDGDGTSRP